MKHPKFTPYSSLLLFTIIPLAVAACGIIPASWLSALPVHTVSCDEPLQAEIHMVAPHWGPPRMDMDVAWEVTASGCTGRYVLKELPQVKPFSEFGHFFRYYGSIQKVQETITVQSVDGQGNVLTEKVVQAEPFTTVAEAAKFLSPPSDARAESVHPREDGLGCRIEKISKLSPDQANVEFRLVTEGDTEGANFNGYAAKNGQIFSVPANEYRVYRAIGVVFGARGHAVCQMYFTAPRCQIGLVENSFDLVRKKITALGKVERVVVDGESHEMPNGKETLIIDEVPLRVGKTKTQVVVYGQDGDMGSCTASFEIPSPELKIQPLRAIASSTWKDAKPIHAIDGTTQLAWIAETRGRGWIRIDLGRNFKVSKVRLCADQTNPGKTKHELYIGKSDTELRKVATFEDVTTAGQWLEKKLEDEKEVRFVEVKTVDTASQVSWREIEVYECTTFRKCVSSENGTIN